jgi:hypothetical protein
MTRLCCSRTRSLTALGLLGLLLAVALGPGRAATARLGIPPEIIPGIPQKVMRLPNALTSRLQTTKQRADLQELQRTYFVRNGIPHLRALGVECRLLAVDRLEYQPTAAQIQSSQVLVGPIAKYRDLILHRPVTIPTPLPDVVDHRPQQTPIKNQNPRGTCYAFASIAGLESAYGGGALDLSENYANYWFMKHEGKGCKSDSVSGFDWGSVLSAHAMCTETVCPYLTAPFPASCNDGASPAPAKRTDAASHAPYRITSYTALWRDESVSDSGVYANNPGFLRAALASGKDVVIGLFTAGWTDSNMEAQIDVRLGPDGNPLPASGGHVMLVVGYDDPHQYFIVKNSWGTPPGHEGYLFITYDYFRTYAQLGYVINEVQPLLARVAPRVLRRM